MRRHQMASRYCENCRKRRIKCDKTLPSCRRCQKSGDVCKGYDPGLRMESLVVVKEPGGSQRLARFVPSCDPPPGSDRSRWSLKEPLSELGPPPKMNLSPFQEHMAFTYFFATYGWACFWKPFLQLASENDLAPMASRICSLSLAYGHMGLGHGDGRLKAMGLELYGRSLLRVHALLDQGGTARKELARLCVPFVILGMYSFAIDGDLRSIHNLGVAQILRHCGPEVFQAEPLLTAYRSCRALLICESCAIRRRTFMEEPIWKTLPWKRLPKTALDHLVDILADMPGVVNDMAASEHPISPVTMASFHRQVGGLRMQLQSWRHDWGRSNPAAASEVASDLRVGSIDTAIFREQLGSMIEFGTTKQALEMLTYNAGLIYLMQLEDALDIGQPHSGPVTAEVASYIRNVSRRHPSSPLLLPDEARHICQPALEAFRLIPSLYKNLVITRDRTMVILAPLGIVYCSTRSQPELNRCMQAVLDDIPFFGRNAARDLSVYEFTDSKMPSIVAGQDFGGYGPGNGYSVGII